MNYNELFNRVIYQRSYFLFWNPVVNKAVGTSDQVMMGDVNRARLLLAILEEINKHPIKDR